MDRVTRTIQKHIESADSNNFEGIREWIITNNLRSSLELQNIEIESWDPIIVYFISSKMGDKIAQHWEDSDEKEMPELKTLFKFLKTQIIIGRRTSERKKEAMDGQSNVITTLAAQANQSSPTFSFLCHQHGNQNNFSQN